MLRMNPLKMLATAANRIICSCQARGHAEHNTSIRAVGETDNPNKSQNKQNLIS